MVLVWRFGDRCGCRFGGSVVRCFVVRWFGGWRLAPVGRRPAVPRCGVVRYRPDEAAAPGAVDQCSGGGAPSLRPL